MMTQLHIDDAVCISLNYRKDRREKLEAREWKKLGFIPRYFLSEKDNEDPQRGCFMSHKHVIVEALEANKNNLLVFEDDVFFEKSVDDELAHKINRFIDQFEYDILFLGQIVGRMWPVWPLRGVVGARGAGGHGYIISRSGMQKLRGINYRNKGIDGEYKQDYFNTFCLCPMIVSQHPHARGESDLTDFETNRQYWLKNSKKQFTSLVKQSYKFFNPLRWPKKII